MSNVCHNACLLCFSLYLCFDAYQNVWPIHLSKRAVSKRAQCILWPVASWISIFSVTNESQESHFFKVFLCFFVVCFNIVMCYVPQFQIYLCVRPILYTSTCMQTHFCCIWKCSDRGEMQCKYVLHSLQLTLSHPWDCEFVTITAM